MKIKLNKDTRKYIEVTFEIEDAKGEVKEIKLKYFDKNGKQIKKINNAVKNALHPVMVQDAVDEVFKENLVGEEEDIKALFDFYEEYANILDLQEELDASLKKHKKRG